MSLETKVKPVSFSGTLSPLNLRRGLLSSPLVFPPQLKFLEETFKFRRQYSPDGMTRESSLPLRPRPRLRRRRNVSIDQLGFSTEVSYLREPHSSLNPIGSPVRVATLYSELLTGFSRYAPTTSTPFTDSLAMIVLFEMYRGFQSP